MNVQSIKYIGFHPSEFTQNYLQEKLDHLLSEAPKHSTLQATFNRHSKEIKAQIALNSAAGKFFATATGTKLKDVSHRLIHQLRRQFAKKKDKRHERKTIRGYGLQIETEE